MQAVATAGLMSLSQAAETPGAGAVTMRQSGIAAADTQTQTMESPFTRLLLQSLTQKTRKDAGQETQETQGTSGGDEEKAGEETEDVREEFLSGLCALGVFLPAPAPEAPAADGTAGGNAADHTDQAAASIPAQAIAGEASGEAAPGEFPAMSGTAQPAAKAAAAGRETEAAGPAGQKKDGAGTPQPVGTEGPGGTFGDLVAEKTVRALSSMAAKDGNDNSASPGSDGLREKKTGAPPSVRREQFPAGFPVQTAEEAPGAEAAGKAEAVQKALDRFVQDYRGAETDGQELRIVLEPEHYGELTISVSRGEHGLMAKIRSDDREVCAAIGDQLQKLVSALENKGIQVRDVDVIYGGMGQSADLTQSGAGGQRQFQSRNQTARAERAEGPAAASGPEASPAESAGDGLSGLVEYRV